MGEVTCIALASEGEPALVHWKEDIVAFEEPSLPCCVFE